MKITINPVKCSPSSLYPNGELIPPHPIDVEVEIEILCQPLGIASHGDNLEEARENFVDEFLALWENIAMEKDENLTGDAQRLKKTMMELAP